MYGGERQKDHGRNDITNGDKELISISPAVFFCYYLCFFTKGIFICLPFEVFHLPFFIFAFGVIQECLSMELELSHYYRAAFIRISISVQHVWLPPLCLLAWSSGPQGFPR